MIEQVRSGVVRIEVTIPFKYGPSQIGTGTGLIFEKEPNWGAALVLTNYHVIEDVIAEAEPIISVTVNDSTSFKATVVGIDIERDLAVLKICCHRFTALQFADTENVGVGETVVSVGYALGLPGAATATRGIVSGFRTIPDVDVKYIQTDAPINFGNSGGPLLTASGEVVGINTFKYGGFAVEGLGFAVSAQNVLEQLPRLKNGWDALDAVNVLTKKTYSSSQGYESLDIRVDKFPWVFEWTLEEGGSLLEVSARNVCCAEPTISIDTKTPGSGSVVVYEAGRFLFKLRGEGRYTVIAKVATPVVAPTPSPVPTATPEPTLKGGQQRNFHIAASERGVFVADVLRRQVRVYSLGGALIQEWDSEVLGTEEINGIAVLKGTIYLTDKFNHRVMMFTTNGTYRGQWGSEGTAEGQFREPGAIDAFGSRVYVADTGNNRIQGFSLGGAFITAWGSEGIREGKFRQPIGVGVDQSRVYVVDSENHQVQGFTLTGTFLAEWGGKGVGHGEFSEPLAAAVENSRVFVVDAGNNRVQVFTLGGNFVAEWGTEGSGEGQFRSPTDIDVHAGTVYVVDEGNNLIQMFSISGNFKGSWSINR
jgi:hypothetical protein